MRFGVSGSAGNDYVYSVKDAPRTPEDDAVSYTSNLIWFDPADDLFDVAAGLAPFKSGELIKISGSSTNDGYRTVNKAGTDHMEVNPKTITLADAGPSITIQRGHSLTINESFWQSADPGPSITLWSIGTKVGQSFAPSYAVPWEAWEVVVWARRIGAPMDSLRIGLYSNNSGVPGALLSSGTIPGTELSDEMAQVSVTLTAPVAMNFGTTCWVVVERTGAASATAMYAVGMDAALGYAGVMRIWKVDHWEARVPDCDLPFEVWGRRETTQQIQDMAGSVLPHVSVESPSGTFSRQWRSGEQTVRAEVEELLAAGTSSGKRLLASVSPERVVRVYVEPEPRSLDAMLGMDGRLRLPLGALDEGQLPAGQWLQLAAEAKGLGPLFIERAQYTPGTGYTVLEPRSSAPWENWS
jgi:hypothetical protein